MNLYAVLSEEVRGGESVPGVGIAPIWYHIWELVVARSPSQAKWLAWKNDGRLGGTFTGDIGDIPRMRCRKVASGVKGYTAGVVSDKGEFDDYWPNDMEAPENG